MLDFKTGNNHSIVEIVLKDIFRQPFGNILALKDVTVFIQTHIRGQVSDALVMCRDASFGWAVAVRVDMIKEPASGHVLAVTASYFRKLRIDFERLEFFFHAFRIDEFRNTNFKTPRLDHWT